MLNHSWREHEKLRYVAVGAWNTLFAYIAFACVYFEFHDRVHYLWVTLLAHMIAVANAFILQRYLVFRSTVPWLMAFVRFNVAQLGVLCFGSVALVIMVEALHFRPLIGQVTVMSAAVALSYVLSRNYAFRVDH